jgi:hypothetical protein
MNLLLDTYNKNVGQRSLFSEIIDVDFYDGPTEALCQLIGTEQWFVSSLAYIDFSNNERIFTVLEVSNDVLLNFKSILERRTSIQESFYGSLKQQVNAAYTGYAGKVYLFKGDSLSAIKYELVEIPLNYLQYFGDIETVLEQNEESKLKWKSFFLPSK